MRLHRLHPRSTALARQRGAAALIVVMLLFFVISLVAAYTGRNVVFEQRTSANQYRATVAFEAADAGLEWAMSMLNSGRIDNACQPSVNVADTSFRDRYLTIDAANGNVLVDNSVRDGPSQPSCVFDPATGQWSCSCPAAAGAAVLTAPAGTGFAPAFRVRFIQLRNVTPPIRPAVVRIEVNGCVELDNNCLDFKPAHRTDCGGTVCALVAMQPGLKSVPIAALTAKEQVDLGGSPLALYNNDPSAQSPALPPPVSTGLTVMAGGLVNQAGMVLRGPSGTRPADTVVSNDPTLSDALFDSRRMFASLFGVWRDTYWNQPGAVTLPACPLAGCTGTAVAAAVALNPGRVILVPGNLVLDGGTIGTAADPVLIVASGNITFSTPTTVFGFVYSEAANWATAGAGVIQGGAAAQGQISGTGAFTVAYDRAILTNLRWRTGSMVKVPGSWRDYP